MTKARKQLILDICFMLIGATLTTIGTKYIYDPAGLVTGGVSGLSIVVRALSGRHLGFEIPLWVSNVVFNVPIFLIAWRARGFRALFRTGFVWIVMTLELSLFPDFAIISDNLLLTAIYGSIFYGVGTGLLLLAHSTSAGTDMLGDALHHYFRAVSIGRLIQIIDGIVVVLGAIVFSVENTLFAILSVYITGKITDYILNRGKRAKMALIISKSSDEIAKDILTIMDRGVTGLYGRGMYTGADKTVLICICSNRDIVKIKDIVRNYDENAFFMVSDVSEAMGEGFLEEWS